VLISDPNIDDNEGGGSSDGGAPKSDPDDDDSTPRSDDDEFEGNDMSVEDETVFKDEEVHLRNSVVK